MGANYRLREQPTLGIKYKFLNLAKLLLLLLSLVAAGAMLAEICAIRH
jgi:hypothetical protein